MITQGYVLICFSGEYGDRDERLLSFSEDREELEKIAFEENQKISKLKKQYESTEEARLLYTNKYHDFLQKNDIKSYPNLSQIEAFFKEFPIPDELEDLMFETSEEDEDREIFYLAEVDSYDFDRYYAVRKLAGFTRE